MVRIDPEPFRLAREEAAAALAAAEAEAALAERRRQAAVARLEPAREAERLAAREVERTEALLAGGEG
ncbi:MAG: HlyD family secretion protein, partial [Planctomycetota bacterium]